MARPIRITKDLAARNRELGLSIDGDASIPLWDGEPMDYHMAVDALLAPRTSAVGR